MSNPFAVNPSGTVVQGQGDGTAIAQGLAGVLGQMQQQKENQFRLQQLQTQQAEQQAQQAYYQAQAANEQQKNNLEAGSQVIQREGLRQVGAAQRATLTGQGQPGVFQDALSGGAQAIGGQQGYQSIFGGVTDQNMPAAVEGVQKAQNLTPKPPEPATSQKEFEYYNRLAQTDPKRAAMYKTLFLDPHPQAVINNIGPAGETEFSKEFGKAQVALLSSGEKEARASVSGFPAMNEAYGLVGKSFTGFGANQLLQLARIAGAAGYKPSKDKVADSQTLMKLTRDQTLAYLQTRALGSGTAVSDRDREFMERQSAADLTLDPSSIKRIIRINVGSGIMRMQEAISDLRDQSIAYPQNARQLNAKAEGLQRQLAPIWKRYSEMLTAEGSDVESTRKRLQGAGLQLPGSQ